MRFLSYFIIAMAWTSALYAQPRPADAYGILSPWWERSPSHYQAAKRYLQFIWNECKWLGDGDVLNALADAQLIEAALNEPDMKFTCPKGAYDPVPSEAPAPRADTTPESVAGDDVIIIRWGDRILSDSGNPE